MTNQVEAEIATAGQGKSTRWIIPYIAALFGMMMLQLSNLGFPPLMPSIQKAWGLNFSQVGLFTGINGLASMFMAVPAGLLIQRFGEKKILTAGLCVVAVGLSLVAMSPTFALGLVGRTIWQLGYKATFVASITALSLTIPTHLKASGMGINGALSCVATAIGAPLGGILAMRYGWRGGMWGYVGFALLGVAVFSLVYRPLRAPAPRSAPAKSRGAFRTPIVWLFSLLMCLGMMVGISLTFFLPMALTRMYGFTAMGSAATLSMGYALGVPVVLFCGFFADRIKNRKMVLAGIMLLNVVLSLLMTGPNPVVFRVSAMVVLALGLAVTNLIYAMAGEVLAGREVGNIMGTIGLGAGVAAYFGPQMLGLLRDATGGFAAGWYFMAAVSAISFVIMMSIRMK